MNQAAVEGKRHNLLSVVVPAFNERDVLEELHRRLVAVLDSESYDSEVVYVNDGSTDDTWELLRRMQAADSRISLVNLSRNFGKEIALTAGLDRATGVAVIVIDADLQDPPEVMPALIRKWEEGFDVVYAKRAARRGESALKRLTAFLFYRAIQSMSRVKIPEDTGDFRLLSRRALNAVLQLREHHRFMKGLFAWIGFRSCSVLYTRDPRHAGTTKWNYWKLWNFAIEGLTSFTTLPLRFSTYIGLFIAFGAFIYGAAIVGRTLIFGSDVPGYPSLLTVILFLGGTQLAAIGVLGEYVGRVFNESKQRPLYFISDFLPGSARPPRD